jgi:hypothetical protein
MNRRGQLGDLDIDISLKIECEDMDGIYVAHYRKKWLADLEAVAELLCASQGRFCCMNVVII